MFQFASVIALTTRLADTAVSFFTKTVSLQLMITFDSPVLFAIMALILLTCFVQKILPMQSWKLHVFPSLPSSMCACTSLAHQINEFVSVGQDGLLNVVGLDRQNQIQAVGRYCVPCVSLWAMGIQQRDRFEINNTQQQILNGSFVNGNFFNEMENGGKNNATK